MMTDTSVTLTLEKGRATAKVEGTRVTFSPHQCFAFDSGSDDVACLRALGAHLMTLPGLTLVGSKRFVEYLLQHVHGLNGRILGVVLYENFSETHQLHGLASINLGALPVETQTAFLCETLALSRMQMMKQLPQSVTIVDLTVLAEVAPGVIPARGWTPLPRNIYPIELPEIQFRKDLDVAIVDCPSRNLSLMPNGLGYLNNALKKTAVSFQIVDLDIISYHRFHIHRLFDMGGRITLPGDVVLPEDPWQAEHYDLWTATGGGASGPTGRNEVLEFFRPVIDETIAALVAARPKVLGLSIQGCNEAAARAVALGVKAQLPDITIVVGGFSCYNADVGLRAFPECDYMCIGEADLTAGPLLEALARGEQPFNQPGVLSRFDTPDYSYIPAPMIHNLDQIEFPKYEWCDLSVYRNFNDYQLTPIIASRGCRWSRCTFCAERFYWRIRTKENFVDELEWLVGQGCHLFMFNESDLGGMPERVMEICDEIIRRGLHRKVKLTGQLRVNRKQNRAFFEKLREANFVALRFGIDAFSERTLRLQMKGYTTDMITQNLKDCWEVGIFTEVNWVIGVPGETDQDVEEGIDLILKNRKYIGRLANINPLILVNGSVYWIDPASHNIVLKESQEAMYEKYPRALPADQWHSTDPYIDAQVRKERFERIVLALYDAGFNVGAWAHRVIEDVKFNRDKARTGSANGDAISAGEFEVAGGKDAGNIPSPTEAERALEVASQRSPLAEETPVRPVKALPMYPAQDTQTSDADKPLAEPPLFGIAGESPRMVRKMDTHAILFYNGWYYGIPAALSSVDVTSPEESGRWANSRGHYDDQKKQRASGSYMRVDSVGDASESATIPSKPRILQFGKMYLAVDQEALKDPFGRRSSIERKSKSTGESKRNLSVWRQMAELLPASFEEELRRLIRQERFNSGNGGYLSDLQLARLLPHAVAVASVPGMLVGETIAEVDGMIRKVRGEAGEIPVAATDGRSRASGFTKSPVLLRAMPEEGYDVISYEGWIYGMPHALGSIDLTEIDVIEMPGVIRDVSRDAVENEILALSQNNNRSCSAVEV
ncbi:MAG: B12-binding domain-containing radical SAM protein [Nitrospirae bacterium]|nr:B12-binding domain-containing radical SAM protein [Nitrospirota bacterium]